MVSSLFATGSRLISTRVLLLLAFAVATFTVIAPGAAEANGPTSLGRTPWEINRDPSLSAVIPLTGGPYVHGDVALYAFAPAIPAAGDSGWGSTYFDHTNGGTRTIDGATIGFGDGGFSRIDEAGYGCFGAVDFTFFQTLVDIPAGTTLTSFTIAFSGMDDGSRITIFNSDYPGGLVVPGSYVFLGGSGTSDLSSFVVDGETNRVVVTQVDDCPVGNTLNSASVVLNGDVIPPEEPTNTAPDCSTAASDLGAIWPPNHKMVSGSISGVTDDDGNTVTLTITSIEQDEPVNGKGDGNTAPDATIGTNGAFEVRAERSGKGDGRVYVVTFEGDDGNGGTCTGSATITVPHDKGKKGAAVDSGDRFDSTSS